MVSSGAFLMFSLYVYEALKRKGWGRWEYFRKTARSLFNTKKWMNKTYILSSIENTARFKPQQEQLS